jgi:cytochrome o ubiquinol oxidase subunit 3
MIGLLTRRAEEGRTKQRMLMFSLYWHFLDLIWVGILSVVFLAGLA